MDTNTGRALAWRNQAKSQQANQPTELSLPSGARVLVRRPPVVAWMHAGRLPQTLVSVLLKAGSGQNPQKNLLSEMNDTQFMEAMTFMADAVREAVIEPRIVVKADPDNPDEIGLEEIPDEDFNFLFEWIMSGAVQTNGGEVSTGELANFPPDRARDSAGANSGEIQPTAEQVSGHP